jgi:peptide subunit release factor RF-3
MKPKKLIKEIEVTINIKCYTPIYAVTYLKDLQGLLDIFREVHEDACIMRIEKEKQVKIKS